MFVRVNKYQQLFVRMILEMEHDFYKNYIMQSMIIESDNNIPSKEQIKEMEGLDKWYAVMQNVPGITDLKLEKDSVEFLFRDEGYVIEPRQLATGDGEFELSVNTFGSLMSLEAAKSYEKDIIWLLRRMGSVVKMHSYDELDFVVNMRSGDFYITVNLE